MKKWTKFFTLGLGVVMMLAANIGKKPTIKVDAESVTYSMTPNNATTGRDDTSYIISLTEFTYNNINWNFNQWNPKSLQVKTNQASASNEFRFYNTSAFPGKITKVVLTFSALSLNNETNTGFRFVGGNEAVTSTSNGTDGVWNSTNKTITWEPDADSEFSYFAFYQNGQVATGTNKLATSDAIVVTYEKSQEPTDVLESLVISGAPNKTEYEVGESFDPSGLTVVGTYSESGEKDVTSEVDWNINPSVFSYANLSSSVTVKASILTIESSDYVVNNIKVSDLDLTKYYQKVESNFENWTGKYILTYEDDSDKVFVYDGSDNVNGYYDNVTVSNNKIIAKNELSKYSFTVSEFNDGYSIQLDSNNPNNPSKYIAYLASGNGQTFNNQPQELEISFSGGYASILSESKIFSFNANSGQCRFRFYSNNQKSVNLYKYTDESAISFLDTPSFNLDNNSVVIDGVENATSYIVGIFDSNTSVEPKLSYNISETTYQLPILPQNVQYYVRVKACGDGETYLNSEYSEAIEYMNETISVCSLEDAVDLTVETSGPYTYYQLSGTIVDIDETYDNNFYLTDGVNKVYVYRLKSAKDSKDDFSLIDNGLTEGDTITIIAYKTKFNSTVELVGYYVSSEVNYKNRFITNFSSLKTMAQLSFAYTTSPSESTYFEKFTSEIAEGDYLICGIDNDNIIRALKNSVNSSRFSFETITIADERIESGVISSSLIWHITRCGDYWTIYNSTTKMYAGGTNSKNQGALISDISDLSKWTITKGEGVFVFENYGRSISSSSPENKYLRGNSDNGFATYASTTGQAISLFKLGEAVPSYSYKINNDNGKNLISLNFGAFFAASLKKNLDSVGATEYGVAYKIGDTDSFTYRKMTGAFVEVAESGNPIDETLDQAIANEHLFQFRLVLSGIPATDFDVDVTAKVYVKIGDDYYFMEEKSYSINSIASTYLNKGDNSLSQYSDVLRWLSTYTED